jgi:predicted nuclease of predicted toxin-antitoxin system
MKLLVDMNLSPRWITFLNGEGFHALHWSSVGKPSASDSEIMGFAAKNEYVLLTYDLDFSAILAANHGEKPSVVQIRMDEVSPQLVSTRVIAVLQQLQSELEAGALVTIDSHRTRVRLLPLKRGQ